MLWDTLERVNKLRMQALQDSEYLESAQLHADSIHNEECDKLSASYTRRKSSNPKKLSDIYENTDFSVNPGGQHH